VIEKRESEYQGIRRQNIRESDYQGKTKYPLAGEVFAAPA
jgi:hypothetical protein